MSRIRRHWATLITTAVAASGVGLVAAPGAAHAAGTWVIDVTTRADDGSPTSLRGAIDQANATPGSWLIRLQPGDPYVLDRACQQGDPDDNHGGDLDITTTDDVTISAAPGTATIAVGCAGERVLDHGGAGLGTLRLDGIALTGGNLPDGEPGDQGGNRDGHAAAAGGALRSTGKAVVLTGSRVHDNRTGAGGVGAPALFAGAGGNGGMGGSGSAIHAARLELRASIVEHNKAGRGGRGANGVGLGNDGGTGGIGGTGAIMAGEVVLERSVVRENFSGAGGDGGDALGAGGNGGDGGDGGAAGGIYTPTLSMLMATLAGNGSGLGGNGGDGKGASAGHGGNGGAGGGAFVGTAQVDRSTIHGNVANLGGRTGDGVGLVAAASHGRGGGLLASGPIELRWSTITSNKAETGAANLQVPAGSTRLATIIGDARGAGTDCSNAVLSLGHNVTQTPSCGLDADDLAVADVNTVLGPLDDNGGATPTRLPLLTGGLADLIPAADCIALLDAHWDQRQEARPYGDCEPGAVELPPTGSSRFVPLPPTRAFDTREPGLHAGYVGAGETRTIPLAGVGGVPGTGATAVAINLTVDQAGGPGFFTAWPAGGERPLASSINTVRAGQTLANLVIVPLGADGAVSLYAQTGGHLLADVVGYFEPAGVARGGRIVPLRPTRLFDTRSTDGPGPSGKLPAGGEHWITVLGEAGVPQEHVAAVVLNLTGTDATGAGYVTLYPDGQDRPLASSLNLGGPGAISANLTIVPLGDLGRIRMFSQSGTHLVGDVTGYITDDAAPAASAGLMVPLAPARVFDTRGDVEPSGFVGPGETIDPRVAGVAGIPPFAAAALLNVTATSAAAAGYVTGWPTGTDRPVASTLNVAGSGETRANAAILPIGAAGRVGFYSQSGTHLLADAAGYLLPDPQSGLLGP